jgi:hypothetical protein
MIANLMGIQCEHVALGMECSETQGTVCVGKIGNFLGSA